MSFKQVCFNVLKFSHNRWPCVSFLLDRKTDWNDESCFHLSAVVMLGHPVLFSLISDPLSF